MARRQTGQRNLLEVGLRAALAVAKTAFTKTNRPFSATSRDRRAPLDH
jgi:hypothetical protein